MRKLVVAILTSALFLSPFATFAGGTAGAANGRASCVGIEVSEISPPGSSEELPGGAAQVAEELRAAASGLGAPPGALFSGFAKLHEGSHEACDEAVE